MAWRIARSVVRGEIDNRIPGKVNGTLFLEGLKEPVILDLEGDCEPDLAGRQLTFRSVVPPIREDLEGFAQVQSGEVGAMTAKRKARLPSIPESEIERCIQERKPIPTRWCESLFLEWFSVNGRVLIEGARFECQLSPVDAKRPTSRQKKASRTSTAANTLTRGGAHE